jgi:hypothetical protein
MNGLVIAGIVLTLLGLAGLIGCVLLALKARRSGGDPAEVRRLLQRAFLLNFAALGVSALGLCGVVVGLMFP